MFRRDSILFVFGIAIIVLEVVNVEIRSRPFHYEFLVLGAALCGIPITLGLDKKK